MAKLTKAQLAALAALDAKKTGIWVPTAILNWDGVGTATLRSLFETDLVDAQVTRNAKYWQITDAGRQALSEGEQT